MDNSGQDAEIVFKCINSNDHRKLKEFLEDNGSAVDVVDMQDTRQYTALAFAAYRNHTTCFGLLFTHASKHNLPLDKNKKPM